MKLYNELDDKNIVYHVNEIFYEKVYKHPWLSKYFANVDQDFITKQQTDFIVGAIGGPKNYSGRLPSNAHTHMLITEKLFNVRTALLKEALLEANAPQSLVSIWLKIDDSFRHTIVNPNLKDCKKRFSTDEILAFEEDGSPILSDAA